MDYLNAFWVGGLICALVQILLDRTKLMPGRVMVMLVCSGAVLGFLGIYEPFRDFAGAGAGVPLLGFGNTLYQGIRKAVDEDGFWAFHGKLHGQRRGNFRRADLFLSCKSHFPAENEGVRQKSRRTDRDPAVFSAVLFIFVQLL